MKVCIDIQSVIKKPTGVGHYTLELVRALAALTDHSDITLSYFNFLGKYSCLDLFPNQQIQIMPGRVYAQLWKKFHFPPMDWLLGKFDVYHFPNFCLPPMTKKKGKYIITVHDLAFIRYPDSIEPKNLSFLQKELPRSLKLADKIITVSDFTKKELVELCEVSEDKVVVVNEGVNDRFKKTNEKTIDLPESYILAVGTLEPRKNLEGLIKAFHNANLKNHKLVIAGGKGWFYDGIFRLVERLDLLEKVIFMGYVSDDKMPELYARAELFVFPSFYEGFGLPPLEAMACGTPVVSTRFEALGDAACFIDPKDIKSISDGILKVLKEPKEYANKGLEQAKKYTWKKTAEDTLKLYKEVCG